MNAFLVFTLHAPLMSWGEIAVGETRGTWTLPSRSAILGLIAAALGFTREGGPEHDALDSGYGLAVRLNARGTPLVDYHTTQTVRSSVARKLGTFTRAKLLAAAEPDTTLSRRAYRQDSIATAAIWARADARWPLDELRMALRRPAFVLYAGRKANAFSLPLAPEVLREPTLADAFLRRSSTLGLGAEVSPDVRQAVQHVWDVLRPAEGWGREVAHDRDERVASGLDPLRVDVRRDVVTHRKRWHFTERTVEVGLLPVTAEAEVRS